MAKGQTRNISTVTIGLFVFVAGFLASTVILVILYTNQADLTAEAQRLEEFNAKLISQGERTSVPQFQIARSGGPTVVGLLEAARAETARMASGDQTDDVGGVQAKLDELLTSIRSDGVVPDGQRFEGVSYHESITMLYEAFKVEHALRTEADTRVTELSGEVDRVAQTAAQLQTDFENRVTEQTAQFTDAEAGRTRFRAQKDEQTAQLERDFEARKRENDADLTQVRQQNADLGAQVDRLKDRLTALSSKVGDVLISPKALSTARTPDGRILSHIPGDEFVFIDLGEDDKLVLGLRFAVYSGGSEIPPDGRAKAQIEVVSIDADSSECKIIHLNPNEVVLPDDLIANPIYDANRRVRFLVMGGFDLDHDGLVDANGEETIKALVNDWGGEVSLEITALLDFVVLGRAPRTPRPPRDQTSEATERFNRLQAAYDQYMATLEAASTLQVPVLRQEVFLDFLGFSRTGARR